MRERILELLLSPTPSCLVRGLHFMEVPEAERSPYLAELATLLGTVSDSNVVSRRSGTFVDEVKPSDPRSMDVTFQLGACEIHADESSKLRPEDVVVLWCAQPAEWGGSTLLWLMSDLVGHIAELEVGKDLLEVLRTPDFPFGGKLRQPPKILRARIYFADDGVRYRRGSIQDAADVTHRPLRREQRAALDTLMAACAAIPPYAQTLKAGEALGWMNRRALHSRTDFTDRRRLLYRTRCFNDALSNHTHDLVEWVTQSEN